MSKSPLNHNPFGSIGKKIRIGKNKNSQANQFQGALGKIKSLAQNNVVQDPLGLLPDQSINGQAANAASAVAQQTQQAQVAQGTGLNTLTQGPTSAGNSIMAAPVETGTLADKDYNTLMGGLNAGSAFAMKSPLKQGSYENPEQVVDVDTNTADAIDQIGQITSNVVSKSGDETDSDDNKKE